MKTLLLLIFLAIAKPPPHRQLGTNVSVKNLLGSPVLSVLKRPLRLSDSSASFCQGHFLALQGNKNIVAPVGHLLFACRPSNISGFVIPAIVGEAVNRMILAWPSSDVGQELIKIVQPCLVHLNASPSVAWVILGFRVVAAGFNATPNSILRGDIVVALSVNGVDFGTTANGETTTGCLPPNIAPTYFNESPTITLTSEPASRTSVRYLTNNG